MERQIDYHRNPNTNARGANRLAEIDRDSRRKMKKRAQIRQPSVTQEQLLSMEVRAACASSGRKASAPALSPLEVTPSSPIDTARDVIRSKAKSGSIPIYNHPFIGCKVANIIMVSTATSWSGAVFNLSSAIATGSQDNQRTGDIIRVIGLDYKMRMSQGTAAAPSSNSEYQIQVVWSPLTTVPVNTVYQDVGTAYSGVSAEDWDYRPVVKRHARICTFVDAFHPMRIHSGAIRCNELTNYDQNSTNVATGAWAVVVISGEDPAAPTQLPYFYGVVQMYYQDV